MFTEKDYPKIIATIEQQCTVPLNLNCTEDNWGDVDENDWIQLGYGVEEYEGDEEPLQGNLTCSAWWDDDYTLHDGKLRARFKPVTLADGSAGITFTYAPLKPEVSQKDYVLDTYNKTNLISLLSLDDFIKELEKDAEWLDACFATADSYTIFFEVTPTSEGGAPRIEEEDEPSLFENKAIPAKFNGVEYSIHVYESQD